MYSIGIDVSKSSLNIHIPKNNLDLKIDNNLKALKTLYSKLKKIYKKEIDKLTFVMNQLVVTLLYFIDFVPRKRLKYL